MDLYPLQDCVMFPLDEDYNEIVIYYYTDNPSRPYDAFVRKEYNIPDETPLYLCKELWKWEGGKYTKKDREEKLLKKHEAKALLSKYLRFMVPTHEWDFSYKTYYEKYKNYKPSLYYLDTIGYYNLGQGGRWNRTWEGTYFDEGDDSITMMFGAIY